MTNKTPNPKLISKLQTLGAWQILRTDTEQCLCVVTAHSHDEALIRARYLGGTIANMPEDNSLLAAEECTDELKELVACQDGYFLVFEPPQESHLKTIQ